jgi:hypothetical protein
LSDQMNAANASAARPIAPESMNTSTFISTSSAR